MRLHAWHPLSFGFCRWSRRWSRSRSRDRSRRRGWGRFSPDDFDLGQLHGVFAEVARLAQARGFDLHVAERARLEVETLRAGHILGLAVGIIRADRRPAEAGHLGK